MRAIAGVLGSVTPVQVVLILAIIGLVYHQLGPLLRGQNNAVHLANTSPIDSLDAPLPLDSVDNSTAMPVAEEPVLTCPVRLPSNASTTTYKAVAELLPFFLFEDPAFDVRPLLGCFQRALNLAPVEPTNANSSAQLIPLQSVAFGSSNSDFALRAITDASYIEALRRHPLRREKQKDARMTIVAMSPWLSWALPEGLDICSKQIHTTHAQRMEKTNKVLVNFLTRPRSHTTAVFCNGCRLEMIGTALHETLRHYHPLILSSAVQQKENDMNFGAKRTVLKRVNALGHFVLPSAAIKPTWLAHRSFVDWSDRKLKMAVDLDFTSWTSVRKAFNTLATRLSTSGLAPSFGLRASALRPEVMRVESLNEAQFALVLDGKNFQIFFDALSFGTIPIFMSDLLSLRAAMPFGDQIDWDQVFFGIDGMSCVREQQVAVGLLLDRLLKPGPTAKPDWKQVSDKLLAIHEKFLSLPDYMPDYRNYVAGKEGESVGSDGVRYQDVTGPAVEALLRSLSHIKPAAVVEHTSEGAAAKPGAPQSGKRTPSPKSGAVKNQHAQDGGGDEGGWSGGGDEE